MRDLISNSQCALWEGPNPSLGHWRKGRILTLLQDSPAGALGIMWLSVGLSSSALVSMGCSFLHFPTPNFSSSLKSKCLHDALISAQKRYDAITEHLPCVNPTLEWRHDPFHPNCQRVPTLLLRALIPAHEPLLPLSHPPFVCFSLPSSPVRPVGAGRDCQGFSHMGALHA